MTPRPASSVLHYAALRRKRRFCMAFKPQTFDYEKSPFTGLVRESWIEAGKYLLEGKNLGNLFGDHRRQQDFGDIREDEREYAHPKYAHHADGAGAAAVHEHKPNRPESIAGKKCDQ